MTGPASLSWVNGYVGIPFAELGADRAGCNCWGLVRLVLRERRGLEVPAYSAITAADLQGAAREFRKAIAGALWLAIAPTAVAPLDCVLMTAMTDGDRHRLEGHVGIMVAADRVLHVWRATHAVIMPLDHPRLRNKLIGFYRHRDLVE